MKRTMDNTAPLNLRVDKAHLDAFNDAHGRLKKSVPKSHLMDRAIELLIADLRKNRELTNG